MKISELIAYLSALPSDAVVFEERESELRELHADDLNFSDDADGHPIDWAEYGADDAEGAGLAGVPIVIFGAWS